MARHSERRGRGGAIRLGIIGCGAIVRAQHLPAIRAAGSFELVTIADPSPESAADGAAVWLRFPPDRTGCVWQDEAGYREEGAVHSGAVQQWVEFANCIRTGSRPWCDLTRARESIRLAVAAQRSLDEGCIVTL